MVTLYAFEDIVYDALLVSDCVSLWNEVFSDLAFFFFFGVYIKIFVKV